MRHRNAVTTLLLRHPFALLSLLAASCAPPGSQEILLPPDSTFDDVLGARGAYGVHVERRRLEPPEGGAVEADVFVPFTEAADPAPGRFPPAIVIQGGAVPVERYRWLGAAVASRGVVVAAPTHPLDLAIFASDHGVRALAGLRAAGRTNGDALAGLVDDVPAVVMGHSLGGVVGAKVWRATSDEEILHLALLASYPDSADSFEGRQGRVVSLLGTRDGRSKLDKVVAGAAAFEHADLFLIDEMTHYQWTDEAKESEIETDADPTVPDDQVRSAALPFVHALIDDAAGRQPWPLSDERSWPAGVRVP